MRLLCGLFLLFCSHAYAHTSEAPKVLGIYPSNASIPVNVLRFYIHFSQPMQEMNILQHVKLTNAQGEDLTGVFYENQYELWNQDRTEVTLLVDPGRVKTGLKAHNTMGRAFVEGQKYTLSVDGQLLNFNDQPLASAYHHTFVAVATDMDAPDMQKWHINQPTANTKKAIIIQFNDTIDHVSAYTYIKIVHADKVVDGKISLLNYGQVWQFIPSQPWHAGDYQIVVNPRLEDIAANSMNQVFDHEVDHYKSNNDVPLYLPITIR